MKTARLVMIMFFTLFLIYPLMAMAKGYMGGRGETIVAEEPTVAPDDTGEIPDEVEGPLNDKMSDAGKLFGDLYVILRQQGVVGDRKLVPQVNADGDAVLTGDFQLFSEAVNDTDTPDAIVGGEPVLTVIDPDDVNAFADYGWYAADTDDNGIGDTAVQSPYPAQCVQPVASYERWGDISSKTGLTKNRLPMTISYDATWERSECEVGQLVGTPTVNQNTGELTILFNEWFIEPCVDEDGNKITYVDEDGTAIDAVCNDWLSPVGYDDNGNVIKKMVVYEKGVLWTALIGEVKFGRLNLSRSPEAVLQSSFDEAINNINSPDTIAIEIDASGRLLLTKNVYDELLVDPATGLPKFVGIVKKAIDSPLENVALYVKLMKDGHLVTPGNERMPIDRSKNGGIPLWKMLELTDGPGAKALRPTIDIAKMEAWGLDSMVNVDEVDYFTYFRCLNDAGGEVACLISGTDPSPEVTEPVLVGNPLAVSRELVTVLVEGCPDPFNADNPYVCEGPFTGIRTDDVGTPDEEDLNFAASHIAAAADKTGHMTVDMIVYLNSILGINQVLGYSEYDSVTGEPTDDAIDYEKNPVYFNFRDKVDYGRSGTFGFRGNVTTTGGGGFASTYNGEVTVLQGGESNGEWTETNPGISILGAMMDGKTIFDNIGLALTDGFPNGLQAAYNIFGFTQQADDNLSVIKFIHTYQIPGLR